jgi:hypothetical protein
MTPARAPRDGKADGRPRKQRRRTTPKWLNSSSLEAVARSRCLMLLSVLSGETPVSEAIGRAKISRGTYYQLETRALKGMLAALNPMASTTSTGAAGLSAAMGRIGQLEAQVKRLQQDKRRTERLLLLTRKSIRAPLTTSHRGRWPKPRPQPSPNAMPPGASSP